MWRLGFVAGSYTAPTLSAGFVIRRIHVEALRQRIRTITGWRFARSFALTRNCWPLDFRSLPLCVSFLAVIPLLCLFGKPVLPESAE